MHGRNDIVVARIRRAIENLRLSGNVIEYREAAGMLSALDGDVDQTQAHFNAALAASGNNVHVLLNYAIALLNLGRLIDSTNQLDQVIARAQDDVSSLHVALKLYNDSFNDRAMDIVSGYLERLGMDIPKEIDGSVIGRHYGLLEKAGISWEDAAERVALAAETARKAKDVWPVINSQSLEGESIVINFDYHHCPPDLAADVEDAIQAEISRQPFSKLDELFIFRCGAV